TALLSLLLSVLWIPGSAVRAVPHALIERLHAPNEVARLLRGLRQRFGLRWLSHGACGFGELLLEPRQVHADVLLHRTGVLARLALQRAARVPDLFANLLVANRSGG